MPLVCAADGSDVQLNKWEMLTNGSGWSHFFAFACFYYHELVLDRVWAGEEKGRDRLKLLVLPWLIILVLPARIVRSMRPRCCYPMGSAW